MRDGQPLQLPFLGENVNGTPVRNGRYGHVGHGLQRGFILERSGKDGTDFGEQGRVLAGSLALGDVACDFRCANDVALFVANRRQ